MRDDKLSVSICITLQELRHGDDDVREYELRVGVVGVDRPLEVRIESQYLQWPHVTEYVYDGGVDLPERLRDALVFRCFDLLDPHLDGTDFASMVLPDATPWVEVQFLDAEARVILGELRRHVTPGLVADPRAALPPGMIPWRGHISG